MTPAQIGRRDELLARNEAVLERWPERSGPEFASEMGAVAQGLEELARAADSEGSLRDALERSRIWRYAGNAWSVLGAGHDRTQLEHAAAAYRSAEEALAEVNDAVELVKLNYCYGNTLLKLSEGRDLKLAAAARARLAAALELARIHMPSGIAALESELGTAEQVVALLRKTDGPAARIERLRAEAKRSTPHLSPFDKLTTSVDLRRQQFELKRARFATPRSAGFDELLQRLGEVGQRDTQEQPLEQAVISRGRSDSRLREFRAEVRTPPRPGGVLSHARSQSILATLQTLKSSIATVGTDPNSPAGLRETAMQLFARIARVTTAISRAGTDAMQVLQLESDHARGLAGDVRLTLRRCNVLFARPIWPHPAALVDGNRVFYSGGMWVRSALEAVARDLDLELSDPVPTSAEPAIERWQALRTSGIAVFDLASASPQVCYELGIALALGSQLLLLAPDGEQLPFDVAQTVERYDEDSDLRTLLATGLDAAFYRPQIRPAAEASLAATLAEAERLATEDSRNLLAQVALKTVRISGNDPVKFAQAVASFIGYLGPETHDLLYPRWPGSYPDPSRPRCFAVVPFHPAQEPAHAVIVSEAGRVGVRCVRRDVADEQQLVESIWSEICGATHVTVDLSGLHPTACLALGIANTLGRRTLLIGSEGTAGELKRALPSVAMWRCHTYLAEPDATPEFRAALRKFFAPVQAVRR